MSDRADVTHISRLTSPFSALIVTHYARILGYITPDIVHVMVNGKIVQSGGEAFAKELEQSGYAAYGSTQKMRITLS